MDGQAFSNAMAGMVKALGCLIGGLFLALLLALGFIVYLLV